MGPLVSQAGRCSKATLLAADFYGEPGCENGHCECGYYDGLRVEPFEGPFVRIAVQPPFPEGAIQRGYAEHHGDIPDAL